MSAHRPLSPDGVRRAAPAWHDLDEAGRQEAFAATWTMRQLEAALDPQGMTSTARAVLAAITRSSG
ncbi:MAG: hypothetical protein R3B72_21110 [Polyangiaceae bacterium]